MDVRQGDSDFVASPACLETQGVGSCICVAFLNRTTGEAGLLHDSNLHHGSLLQAFLAKCAARVNSGDTVEFWIGGGDKSGSGGSEVVAARCFVRAKVSNRFPSANIAVKWLGRGRYFNVEVTTDPPEIKANRLWL